MVEGEEEFAEVLAEVVDAAQRVDVARGEPQNTEGREICTELADRVDVRAGEAQMDDIRDKSGKKVNGLSFVVDLKFCFGDEMKFIETG